MGSDDFSLPILRLLLTGRAEHHLPVQVVGVVTQPDRPAGRGRRVIEGPIKTLARDFDVAVLQPARVRDRQAQQDILSLSPDLIVVASFGQILPTSLLEYPRHGSLNLHPSLLPRYRGPSPIVSPILQGDAVTGTTLMLMSEKMDAGPILAQTQTAIGPCESGGELRARLADASAALLAAQLPLWIAGDITPVPQDETQATYTRRVDKVDGHIVWKRPAIEIARQTRAYDPWPAATALWRSETVRLFRGRAIPGSAAPGTVIGLVHGELHIGTGEGVLTVAELQLQGGKRLPAQTVVQGHRELVSAQLETLP
jgi:methionyl-tRNA formyltransferase